MYLTFAIIFLIFVHFILQVAFIVGIAGMCRKIELLNMLAEHVVDRGEYISFIIPETKTYNPRDFIVVPGKIGAIDLLDTIRRYIALRPPNAPHHRFFSGYRNGKCIIQPVGINTFASMPRKIAEFLGLEHPERFTGHCFRRSAATILGEKGANLWTVKKGGGWKSSAVAEQYIDKSLSIKRKIAETFFGSNDGATTSKKSNSEQASLFSVEQGTSSTLSSVPVGITSQISPNVQYLRDVDADILFDSNTNGIATVHRIISSQITEESVAIPRTVVPAFTPNTPTVQSSPMSRSDSVATTSSSCAVTSTAPIFLPSIPQMPISSTSRYRETNSANIEGSTFHGCHFYFQK